MPTLLNLDSKVDKFITLSLLLVPIFTFSFRKGGTAILLISFFIWLIWGRKQSFKFDTHQRLFLISCAGVSIVSLLSLILANFPDEGSKEITKYLRLLLAYPFMVLLILSRARQEWFWAGIAIASILAGVIGVIDSLLLGNPRADVFGMFSPIFFGNHCILFSYLSFLGFYWFRKNQLKVFSWLSLAGTFSAFYGMIASGSRGAVSSLPILALLIAVYLLLNKKFLLTGIFTLLLSIILIGALLSDSLNIKHRLELIPDQVNAYVVEEERTTSIGIRLHMWRIAWQGFLEKPILGHGVGAYKKLLAESAQNPKEAVEFNNHLHAHSEYLQTLVSKGIVGLFFFLGVLIIPIVSAVSFCLRKDFIYGFALAGTALGFSVFSLTDMTFMKGSGATLFIFIVPALMILGFKSVSDSQR